MADKKHTIEDVLQEYAQTEEGAKHLAEQGIAVNQTEETPASKAKKNAQKQNVSEEAVMTAQERFRKEVEEAQNRPTMREAHAEREEQLKKEIQDAGMGFVEIPMESLPTQGLYYPVGTRLFIRAASGGDIRHWSMTDETSLSDIDNALNYVLERCMRITFPVGTASWKDLKEVDRIYTILAIRDFTFTEGQNELKIKVSENQEVTVHKDDIQFIKLSDKMYKYYNEEKRCFTFPVKNPRVNQINIYFPSVGVNKWLKDYLIRKRDRQESFDKDFITVAPLLISDYRGLNDQTYAEFIRETMNWGIYEWSLVSKIKSVMTEAIEAKMKYIDENGAEEETPLNFQGGIKAIFNINLDAELDL